MVTSFIYDENPSYT